MSTPQTGHTLPAHWSRERLQVFFLLVAIFILGFGISGMLRVWREVGQPFGGFVWGWDFTTRSLTVVVETPWHWPGPQHGLRGGDYILAVDGREPMGFPDVYEAGQVGQEITYLVARGNRQFTVRVPLSRFTVEQLFEIYGFFFFAGLSFLLAGYFLLRNARDRPTVLVAFTLLALAGTFLFHGNHGSISRFYLNIPSMLLLFIPSCPLAGALLIHFFLIFPQPLPVLQDRPWLRCVPYAGAIFLVLFHTLSILMGGLWDYLAIRLFFLSAAVGILLCTARSLWSFLRSAPEERGRVGALGVAMAVGLLLVLGSSIFFLSGGTSILLTELFAPLTIIYPLALVYAVKNAELVGELRYEIGLQRQLEAQARELRRFREEDLRRVANELHDTVLADLRAVELRLESLMSGDPAAMGASSPRDQSRQSPPAGELQALRETVRQIRQQARQVTMGAMPLDFHTVGLREVLEDAVERFRRMAPEVNARLETGPFGAEPPPAVQEAAYWIAVSALNNCREHARASEVRLFVSAEESGVRMMIRDDGGGFDAARVPAGGLGLRNMWTRAAEVGGELRIESGSWGTAVHFSLTLPQNQPIRMLVVEDSEAFVAGLRTALARWAHEVEIVGVAGTADQALALARTLRPDIVLLDLRINENLNTEAADARHGLGALLELRQMPEVRTLVMSFTHDPAWLRAVSETGAWAFWDKDQDVAVLVGLLRQVAAGERLLTAEQWGEAGREQLAELLSPREWEVLLCLEQGLSTQKIADRFEISVRTVEKHVESVLGKLGVHSRLEAVARARELGLLSADRPAFPPPDHTV